MRSNSQFSIGDFRLIGLINVVLFLFICSSTSAQKIVLKTGQVVETLGLRRDRDTVMGKVQVGESTGEVGYQIGAIAKIEFPEPKALRTANELLSQGQPEKAIAEINPVVAYYEPFKNLPGAWWAQSALVKVSALAALQREQEAEPLALEIQKNATDPETSRIANLRLARSYMRKQDFEKAAQICDAAIKESMKPEVLADAWVIKGDLFLTQKQFDAALMAYLHVPIFYPNERLLMPPALLGAGRAYRRLDDLDRAKRSLNDLIAAFPKSAEAALAQTEMQKMQK